MRLALVLLALFLAFGLAAAPPVRRRLRRLARAFVFFLLRMRSRPLAVDDGVMLVVAPHQDDATLGCGGLIFQRRLAGQPVHVLYLTDGSGSHPDHPVLRPEALAALRQQEARLAKFRLGVDSACLRFLGLPDGRLPTLDPAAREDALAALAAHFREVGPATVLLPCRRDGSSEHEAAFLLVQAVLVRAGLAPRLLEYPVWAAWSPRLLFREFLSAGRVHRFSFAGYGPIKSRALEAYASQFQPTPPWPRAVLPQDFSRAFSRETEYFLEAKP